VPMVGSLLLWGAITINNVSKGDHLVRETAAKELTGALLILIFLMTSMFGAGYRFAQSRLAGSRHRLPSPPAPRV